MNNYEPISIYYLGDSHDRVPRNNTLGIRLPNHIQVTKIGIALLSSLLPPEFLLADLPLVLYLMANFLMVSDPTKFLTEEGTDSTLLPSLPRFFWLCLLSSYCG